ncbi:30S ribosomal protein S3 [Candidatus Gottesmanbacteria bacterium]|nr:30S ribosomal protein S3 [Candidatus Gottesmanbacteria bacterium]
MGKKIHPKGFRLGPLYTWDSRWFAGGQQYNQFVIEDARIRRLLLQKLQPAGVAKVEIERSINKINITLHVVRPGMVIGRGGQGMEEIKKFTQQVILKHRKTFKQLGKQAAFKLDVKVEPVKDPYLNSYFLANQIAEQIAKRLPHKRVVHFALEKVMTAGAKGVKIILSGRINGAEISRRETYKIGTIPLSTIREDVDFTAVPSLTKSGYVGVKVWICRKS